MKTIYYFILLLLPIVLITSCEDNTLSTNISEAQANESQYITIPTQSNLVVTNTNGIIYISASDTASNINCFITKIVQSLISQDDAQSQLSQIIISVEKTTDDVNISVDNPQDDYRSYEIDLNIVLPNKFNYSLFLGNGEITIYATTKTLAANLGNGNLYAEVTLIDTCYVSLLLGNGNMNLVIPETTNTRMNATVGNGNFYISDLNFQNQQMTNKQFSGTLGNGCGSAVLSVGNGNLIVSKKQ
jgi:PHD/YefM family antitoxin component YafN of YafNO toxin-antitoxin module